MERLRVSGQHALETSQNVFWVNTIMTEDDVYQSRFQQNTLKSRILQIFESGKRFEVHPFADLAKTDLRISYALVYIPQEDKAMLISGRSASN